MTKAPKKTAKKKPAAKPAAKAAKPAKKNGADNAAKMPDAPVINEQEVAEKIAALRSQVRESFGKVVMAMMGQPRYKHHTLADLQHLVLEPLTLDKIAIAYSKTPPEQSAGPDMAGMAIWASVSEEVDMKIREQIRGGTFPIRLRANEWTSGNINWLLDVIALDKKTTGQVIANFRQVVKEGDLRMHPIIASLVDEETLERMKKAQTSDPVQG